MKILFVLWMLLSFSEIDSGTQNETSLGIHDKNDDGSHYFLQSSESLTDCDHQISVISFIIRSFLGNKFYFVIEQQCQEMKKLLNEIFLKFFGTVRIIIFDETKMEEWITATGIAMIGHSELMVILLFRPDDILKVFNTVKLRHLESHHVQWVAISKNPIRKGLLSNISERTKIVTAERDELISHPSYNIFRTITFQNNSVGFTKVGNWALLPNGTTIASNTTELLPVINNFGNRKLIISELDNKPFLGLEISPDGIPKVTSGIDYHILETLAAKLNFSYDVIMPPEFQPGQILPNGTVTGLVGSVYYSKAHFCIDEMTITYERENILDFTTPYYTEPTVLSSLAPHILDQTWHAFSPFSLEVWILFIVVTILAGPICHLFHMLSLAISVDPTDGIDFLAKQSKGIGRFSFDTFRILGNQNIKLYVATTPGRFMVLNWILFAWLIHIFYSTSLIASLAVPAKEKPIDSLTDLLLSMEHGTSKMILSEGTSVESLFKDAKSGIYKAIYDHFDPSSDYITGRDASWQMVLKEKKVVFPNSLLNSEMQIAKYGTENFHLSRQTFYPQSYGIMCPSGSAYKEWFDNILIRLVESGLITRWSQDIVDEARLLNRETNSNNELQNDNRNSPLSLEHMQGAFVVFGIGLANALIAFIVENFLKK